MEAWLRVSICKCHATLQLGCEMEMAETSGGLSGWTVRSTQSIGKGSWVELQQVMDLGRWFTLHRLHLCPRLQWLCICTFHPPAVVPGVFNWKDYLHCTRVYSWNTYPTRLSVRCQINFACIFAYGSTSCVADHNYHVRFRKGWSHKTNNRK